MKNTIVKLATIFAIVMGLCVATSSAYAQESRNSVGFVAGSTYGLGIGYKHNFRNSPVALQVAGIPIAVDDDLILTGGVALQFTLHRGNYGSTFISVASSVIHKRNRWVSQYDETLIGVGPGIGIEWLMYKHFSFVLDVPAAAFFDSHEGFKSMLPIPNLTLMYTW